MSAHPLSVGGQMDDPYPWTAVVVTCSTSDAALAIKRELLLMQRNKFLHQSTFLLTVEDPDTNIGSGSATLNALLMTVEYLSAKRGFNVLNASVLMDSDIMIVHNGRPSVFDICGNMFLPLSTDGDCTPGNSRTNFEHISNIVQRLASRGSQRRGVWVCSTDMLLSTGGGSLDLSDVDSFPPTDCILFGALATPQYATGHGVLRLVLDSDEQRVAWQRVADILYCRPIEEVGTLTWKETAKVPVVCGLVYLSPLLADQLLSLHTESPLSSCTYLGVDSGTEPLQVSLFFDILAAMAGDISEAAFLAGECGKTYGMDRSYRQNDQTARVRQLVWKKLRQFKIGAVVLEDLEYLYLSEALTISDRIKLFDKFRERRNGGKQSCSGVVNSYLDDNVSLTAGTPLPRLRNCLLRSSTDQPIRVGKNTFLSGLNLDVSTSERPFELGDNLVLMAFPVTRQDDGATVSIPVLFGINDELKASDEGFTMCGLPWKVFCEKTGIRDSDVWAGSLTAKDKCLLTANLFPINGKIDDVLWWLESEKNGELDKRLNKWRSATRICLRDILTSANLKAEFAHRREASSTIAIERVRRALWDNEEVSLEAVFHTAVAEGWSDRLFEALDRLAAELDKNPGKAARVLGNIANLLACLASGEGGLRSGPAANRDWTPAYKLFEKNCPGSIRDGVAALREVRLRWMNVGVHGPHWLIRAARHYEGAAQILIRHAVFSSMQSISICQQLALPQMGVWITCECPARVDLFGGWTDTPPICYELGGSVVNASILVNGKRPIGAKVRRIAEPAVLLCLDGGSKVWLRSVDDLSDYNQPTSFGALAKACIVWTGIAQLDASSGLPEQMTTKHGGGVELHTWSHLPQGSGLGTSSIMAGAIIAALWTAAGTSFDRNALIHGVLCIEQMLTTGGGWQDQVGGLIGGLVHGHTHPELPLRVKVDKLSLRPEFIDMFQRHLVLIYTGKIRLAKNLLQNVLRNWFARDADLFGTFQMLLKESATFVQALKKENLLQIGQLMNEYWRLKKCLAPGAEPDCARLLMEALRPHAYGQLLCGAGGGGFMIVLIKDAGDRTLVNGIISKMEPLGVARYELSIDAEGLIVSVGDERVAVD